jgi:hypothetical protein
MASETCIQPWAFPPGQAWPPDDTEESILGTDLHQMTITNLRLGLNEAARVQAGAGRPVPWQALSQIALLGCVRADGSPYRTYPDVIVYLHPIDPRRGSLTLVADGSPTLIIEVLSDATYEADLDPLRGKGFSYAQAGVREYLAIDPTAVFLQEGIRARRLGARGYQPWEPGSDGHWHSAVIGAAFRLEGVLATVYTPDGRRMLHEGEIEVTLEQERQLRAHDRADLERLRRLLEER